MAFPGRTGMLERNRHMREGFATLKVLNSRRAVTSGE